jgi:hypothetical protein
MTFCRTWNGIVSSAWRISLPSNLRELPACSASVSVFCRHGGERLLEGRDLELLRLDDLVGRAHGLAVDDDLVLRHDDDRRLLERRGRGGGRQGHARERRDHRAAHDQDLSRNRSSTVKMSMSDVSWRRATTAPSLERRLRSRGRCGR